MITNIRTLKNHLENSKVGGNDAIAIIIVIRKLIEKDKRFDNFKWLNHFCNWCMHPEINKPKISVDIINSFISSFIQIGKIDIFWDKGRLHFSYEDNRKSIENYFDFIIDNFRKELTGLLNDYHIDNEFIKTDENFILFFARVLYIVKDSPLRPNNIKNEEYDKLKEKFYKQWIWSKGAALSR